MKKSMIVKPLLICVVTMACVLGLAACGGGDGDKKGSVAATVNNNPIYEQPVTDQIEMIRQQSGLDDTDQWGLFLAENDMTPSSVREQIINSMVEQELIKEGAKELNVTVESSEVDEYINQMKSNYDGDDAWKKALDQAGFTEESYRETIEESLIEQKISEHFQSESTATDEDYLTAAKTYAPYYDGAKRSSHILIKVDDATDAAQVAAAQEKANEILAQIKDGSISFEDAAKQYSGDTGSAENGGDVGWDVTNSFVTEYSEALQTLEKDQISDPVTSTYGVHIIKVTDTFTAPEEITSMDQIPEGFRDSIKEMAVSIKANQAYTDWLDKLKENATIVINDMPKGLPYDIEDMSKYQQQVADQNAASTTTNGTTTTDGTTTTTTDGSASTASGEAQQAQAGGGTASAGGNQ